MVKIKQIRTVDCVVGGFRYASGAQVIGSLLLGLYDDAGCFIMLVYLCVSKRKISRALTKKFEALKKAAGLHRQRSWRAEPLEHGTKRRMGAGRTEDRGGSDLRSFHRRTFPARHKNRALAERQGAAAMHARSGRSIAKANRLHFCPVILGESTLAYNTMLPRPARLGDFPQPAEDFVLSAAHRVEHVERAALGENQVPRIRAPGRIFTGADSARSAAREIQHRDLKFAAAPHVECDLLSVRRPARLGAITVAGRKLLAVAAAGGDPIKLRDRPRRRTNK